MKGEASLFANSNCESILMYSQIQDKTKQPGGQTVFPAGRPLWKSSSPLPQEAGGIPGRPRQGFPLTRNVGFLAILQGPHCTISAHTEANTNLLQSEYSTTLPSHLYSFPNAVTLTLWEEPKDLFNATLPVKRTPPETAGLVSWPSPAAVAQTQTSQNRRK